MIIERGVKYYDTNANFSSKSIMEFIKEVS